MPGSDDAAGTRPERTVPGVVRVMTIEPVEVPASVSGGQSSLREILEERPWLVAAAITVVVAALVVLVRRRR
jgi:hypothetical protein